MFCTQCGQQAPDGSRFCARCGAALPTSGPSAPSPVDTTSTISLAALEGALDNADLGALSADPVLDEQPPAGTAMLVVKRGPNAGSRFLLDAEVTTAGRHPESDIFLDDVTVSRRHAEFRRIEDGFAVRDVGSLNGTYVNRDRIDDVLLSDGDEVQIGKFRLMYFASRRTAGEDAGR